MAKEEAKAVTKEEKDITELILEELKAEFPDYKFYLQVRSLKTDKDKPATPMYTLDVTENIFLDEYEEEEAEVLFLSIKGQVDNMDFNSLKRRVNAKIKPEKAVRNKYSRTVNGRVLYGDYSDTGSVKSLGVKRFKR